MPSPFYRLHLAPDADAGGGATDSQSEDKSTKADDFIAKHGSAMQAVERLLAETYKLRDEKRELKAKLPPEGSLVLSAADAKAWADYRQLGGDPASLRKALDDGKAATEERGKLLYLHDVREAADLHYPGKAKALEKLTAGQTYAFVDTKGEDGKPVREARIKGEGDSTTPLTTWIEANQPEFKDSLKPDQPPTLRGTPPAAWGPPPPPVMPDGDRAATRRAEMLASGRYRRM